MKNKKAVLAVIINIIGWFIILVCSGDDCIMLMLTSVIPFSLGFVMLTSVIPCALGMAAVYFGIRSIYGNEKAQIVALIGIIFGIILVILSGFLLLCEGVIYFRYGLTPKDWIQTYYGLS